MIRTREHLAWHVAGHAYAATMWDFPVHKLSLDGFTEADLADRAKETASDWESKLRKMFPCTVRKSRRRLLKSSEKFTRRAARPKTPKA